jgi:hypothetical protein
MRFLARLITPIYKWPMLPLAERQGFRRSHHARVQPRLHRGDLATAMRDTRGNQLCNIFAARAHVGAIASDSGVWH